MDLLDLGWGPDLADAFAPYAAQGLFAGRIGIQHRSHYLVYAERGELRGEPSGKLFYQAAGPADLPVVGDWVALRERPGEETVTIVDMLPRRSKFSRNVAGRRTEEQILAANIDVVFLVDTLGDRLNIRRLERFLILAAESGARPVILLNKDDLVSSAEEDTAQVRRSARDVPVHHLSALYARGIEAVRSHLEQGVTGALLGPSGSGKSTLINALLGADRLKTTEVREVDEKGRHATTHRHLVLLPDGGMIIDTPGLRELQLHGGEEGMLAMFEDIEQLATGCRFRNCGHAGEPGCAVQAALEDGQLESGRLESYRKLLREIAHQLRKKDQKEALLHKEHWKKITTQYRKGHRKR
jgi:ribosome biogenesis GTPase